MADPKQTAHTPTPWRTRVMGSEGCRIFPDTGDKREDMKFVAMVNGRDLPVDAANAGFIVRCVNSHDKLVEALEAYENAIKELEVCRVEYRPAMALAEAHKLAEAALRAAKEGEPSDASK